MAGGSSRADLTASHFSLLVLQGIKLMIKSSPISRNNMKQEPKFSPSIVKIGRVIKNTWSWFWQQQGVHNPDNLIFFELISGCLKFFLPNPITFFNIFPACSTWSADKILVKYQLVLACSFHLIVCLAAWLTSCLLKAKLSTVQFLQCQFWSCLKALFIFVPLKILHKFVRPLTIQDHPGCDCQQ